MPRKTGAGPPEHGSDDRPGKADRPTLREALDACWRLYELAVVYYRRLHYEATLQGTEPRFRVSWKLLSALAPDPPTEGFDVLLAELNRHAESDSDDAFRVFGPYTHAPQAQKPAA